MNKRRKNIDRLLAIARERREWIKDFVDIGALSLNQLRLIDEKLNNLERARKVQESATVSPSDGKSLRGAFACRRRLADDIGVTQDTIAATRPLGVSPTIRYPPIRQNSEFGCLELCRDNNSMRSDNTGNSFLVSPRGASLVNPYEEIPSATFSPVGVDGRILDYDCVDNAHKDIEQGRCNYDINLEERVKLFQDIGVYPDNDDVSWNSINISNSENGFPDFCGGIDGGTTFSYLGDWFIDTTSDVVPEFIKEVSIPSGDSRRYNENPVTGELEYTSGRLVSLEYDNRLRERFKQLGTCSPAEETTARILEWFDTGPYERKLMWFQYLEERKQQAKALRDKYRKNAPPVVVSIAHGRWQIMPDGMGVGIKCRWRLECGGVKIGIHSNPKGNIPAILIEFGYEALRFRDFRDVFADVELVLHELGFCFKCHKISRIDVQVTTAKPFSLVADAFKEKRIVSRVRSWAEYRNSASSRCDTDGDITEYTGFSGGSGSSVMIRAYDKIKDCFKKDVYLRKLNDLYAVMGVREHLTRVEYELHREFLKQYGIDTIYDFYARKPELFRYLNYTYFRVVDDSKNSHTERQKTADWWEEVQSQFELAFDARFQGRFLQRVEKEVLWDLERMVKQSSGCIRTAIAYDSGDKVLTREEYTRRKVEIMRRIDDYDAYVAARKQVLIQRDDFTTKHGEFDHSKVIERRLEIADEKK